MTSQSRTAALLCLALALVPSTAFGQEDDAALALYLANAEDTMLPMSWELPQGTTTTIVTTSVPRRGLRPCPRRFQEVLSVTRAADDLELDEVGLGLVTRRKGWTTWIISVDLVGLTITTIALVLIILLALILSDICCGGDGEEAGGDDAASEVIHEKEALLEVSPCDAKSPA